MNNHKDIEALRSILLFVESTHNLEDPMLEEIKNNHETLSTYLNSFDE